MAGTEATSRLCVCAKGKRSLKFVHCDGYQSGPFRSFALRPNHQTRSNQRIAALRWKAQELCIQSYQLWDLLLPKLSFAAFKLNLLKEVDSKAHNVKLTINRNFSNAELRAARILDNRIRHPARARRQVTSLRIGSPLRQHTDLNQVSFVRFKS